jgi:S1-C subfamily serine protease
MPLKTHHKIMLGGVSSLVIAILIANSIFIYFLFIKIDLAQNSLNEYKADSQSKINQLTTNILQTRETISSLNNSIKNEISQLRASTSSDFSGIIENAVKSVVTIKTDVAQGTGFVITDDGYVVTNAHVLVGGHEVYAINSDKEILQAEFIGYDGNLDVALLKVDSMDSSLTLSNSDDVQIGEKVIAIGNPLGLQFSVSEGIVSGLHRAGSNDKSVYIQTDAALNPGNSGGPLINKEGYVIGMNNFKISGGESLGFALEANTIKEVINQIALEQLNQEIL